MAIKPTTGVHLQRLDGTVDVRFRKLIRRDAHLAATDDFHLLSNNALGVHDQRIGEELANVPIAVLKAPFCHIYVALRDLRTG